MIKYSGNPVLAIPSLTFWCPDSFQLKSDKKQTLPSSQRVTVSVTATTNVISVWLIFTHLICCKALLRKFFLVKKEWQVFRIYEWKFLSGFFNSKILYIWAGGTLVPGWIWQIFQTYVPSFKNVNKCQKIFHGVSSSHFLFPLEIKFYISRSVWVLISSRDRVEYEIFRNVQ